MKRLSLWIAIILGMFAMMLWMFTFSWMLWLLGADKPMVKFSNMLDALMANK